MDDEEIKIPTKEEIQAQMSGEEEQVVEQDAGPTPEDLATKDGWVPQDDWNGEAEKWVPADEFLRRKPLFEKIHTQNRQIKKIQENLNAMASHHKKVFEASYQKALEELEAQRDRAIDEGDSRTVRDIDREVKRVEQEYTEESAKVAPAAGPSAHFEEWVNANDWYTSNRGMKTRADEVGIGFAQANPDLPEEEVFAYVDERMRIEYPDKFVKSNTQTRKPAAASVESGEYSAKPRAGSKTIELTDQERKVMNTLVRSKQMTKDEYMAEIAKIR